MNWITKINNNNIWDLCLNWETKAGKFCYSIKQKKLVPMPTTDPWSYANTEGEWFESPKNIGPSLTLSNTKVLARAGGYLDYFLYLEYDKKNNVVMWAKLKIASNRVYDSNGPEWQIMAKGYITKDKTMYYWNTLTKTVHLYNLFRGNCVILNTSQSLEKELGKLWGPVVSGPNNRPVSLNSPNAFIYWLDQREVIPKTGPSQVKIDEMSNIISKLAVPEMPSDNNVQPQKYKSYYYPDRSGNVNVVYITNGDVVIRNFHRRKYEDGQIKMYEGARCIVTPKKIIFASRNCLGQWCANSTLSLAAFEGTVIMADKIERGTFAYWAFKTANEVALQAHENQERCNAGIEEDWKNKKIEFHAMVKESLQNADFIKTNENADSLYGYFRSDIMGKCCFNNYSNQWYYYIGKESIANVNYKSQILPIAINILKSPIIEQIYKLGLAGLAYHLCKIRDREDKITPCLGKVVKSTSLLQSLQINSFQCQLWVELIQKIDFSLTYFNSRETMKINSLAILKEILGQDLRSVDNKIFGIYLKLFEKLVKIPQNSYHIKEDATSVLKSILEFHNKNELENIVQHICATGSQSYLNAVRDGWRQYIGVKDYNEVVEDNQKILLPKYSIKTEEDAQKFHDSITALYSLASTKISEMQFDKLSKFWTKYKFEDDKYQIVLPQSSIDIVNEGEALHHCVKSYASKVGNHETNILFLREKSNLNKPFFTIEVTNDRRIQQIHGFGNRWPATEPGILPFLDKWAQEKKLSGWSLIRDVYRYTY